MTCKDDIRATEEQAKSASSVWKTVVNSVFGAAVRLHQYRDARDTLFRRVFHEQEMRFLEETCCHE